MIFDITEAQMAWLNFTNIALGLVVLVCLVAVSLSVVQAVIERQRKRATAIDEVERDMRVMMHGDGHTFAVPGLGVTMADGGEPAKSTKNGK